jgi:hypothetical protein
MDAKEEPVEDAWMQRKSQLRQEQKRGRKTFWDGGVLDGIVGVWRAGGDGRR